MYPRDAEMLSEGAPSPKLIVAMDLQKVREWVSTLYEADYLNQIVEAEVDTGSVRPEVVACVNQQKAKASREVHEGKTVVGVKH